MSKFLTISAFLSVFTLTLRAQLSSPTSDFKVSTAYSPHDSIFIFYQTPLPIKGSLSATTPKNISARFEWSAYDTINKVFLSPFKTEDNVTVSTAVNLEQGGYRVRITASGYDTTMTGWVFLDDITLKLEKNNAGEVLFYRKTCESTNLQATAEAKNFRYFNPANGNLLILNNSVKYSWSANPMPEGFKYSGAKIWIEGTDLPSVNTDYTVRATDNFEMWKEDAVKYITIIPKADFETEFEKKYEDKISAPVEVTFVNNSVYAIKYTWIFGDGDTVYLKDPQKDPEPHTYYQAGQTYTIKLIAESKERCIREDTITLKVDESELERPNVFSPNGDGMNDNFVIYNVSMREFHITIFSRSGRKVYEFQGPDINHWEGWDGKMGNSDASAGIYYYVLEAKSWDKPAINYKPKKTSGFVYLVRDK